MAIDAIVGAIGAIGGAISDVGAAVGAGLGAADIGAGVAAADVGAGVAAADVGAGVAADVALPEILVTPAIAGADVAAGAGAGALTGGALTGAEAAGAGLLGAATAGDLAGAAGAAGAGLATPAEALAGTAGVGAGGALAALSPTDIVGGDFATLVAAGIGPAADLTAPTLTAADVIGTGVGDTALSFAPSSGTIDPLSGVGGGGGGLASDAFASAPAATPGSVSQDLATALNTGQIGSQSAGESILDPTSQMDVGQLTGGTGVSTPQAATVTPAPQIPSAGADHLASFTLDGTPVSPSEVTLGTAPAAGGLSDAASKLFSGSTLKTLAEVAPLAGLGLTLARGQPSLPPALQQELNDLGQTRQLAQQQLAEGSTGQLTAGQIGQINQYKSNAKNKLYQLYASSGRDPTGDTDYIQGLAQIDQNAINMGQTFIDAAIKNGLAAQGVVDSALQNAANVQVQQDQAFQTALTNSLQSFGLITALNFSGAAKNAPTTAQT